MKRSQELPSSSHNLNYDEQGRDQSESHGTYKRRKQPTDCWEIAFTLSKESEKGTGWEVMMFDGSEHMRSGLGNKKLVLSAQNGTLLS